MRLLTCLLLLFLVGPSLEITLEETTYFQTTGNVEQNTGVAGTVTVAEDSSNSNFWRITSNGVPDHYTPVYPNRDNPNALEIQSFSFRVPKTPDIASEASCLPPGPIGVAINGVALFNPWDNDDENAVEGPGAEIFDICDGHPAPQGVYHYHKEPSSCLFTVEDGVPSTIIGVAMDGFAIYGPIDENGNRLTSDDLDECHGRYNSNDVYQYHTTKDYPYILGCFRGTPYNTMGGNYKCFFAEDKDENGGEVTDQEGNMTSTSGDDDATNSVGVTVPVEGTTKGGAGVYTTSLLIVMSYVVMALGL